MKYILIILTCLSLSASAQSYARLAPYKEEEFKHLCFNYRAAKTLFAFHAKRMPLKFTIKPTFNGGSLVEAINGDSFLGTKYAQIMKYDARVKIYITRKFDIVVRSQVNRGLIITGDILSCSFQFRPFR